MIVNSVNAARSYYDTEDVDGFYANVWGGEDIHIGIYTNANEAVSVASRRTVERMADTVAEHLGPERTVLDLGSGYGGAARYLATKFGCQVVALNISEVQNQRHREMNRARGLDQLITIVTGSFEDIPFPAGHFDVVWSQDALCHSDDYGKALGESMRVLKPKGHLIFSDLMTADDASVELLDPAYSRVFVKPLPTLDFCRNQLEHLGFADVSFHDLSRHLQTHYLRLTEETRKCSAELAAAVSSSYRDSLLVNLPLWVNACRDGHIRWGVFHCHRD